MADDDRELFEKALQSLSPADVYRGKFGEPASKPDNEVPAENAGSPEEIQRRREQVEMTRAFADVVPIGSGKTRVPPPKSPDVGNEADLRAEFEAAMAPPPPPKQEPAPISIERSAPPDVHTLNLRGFDEKRALSKLGLFIDLAARDKRNVVRVRIGTNPALLKAVTAWFKEAGLVYIDAFEVAQPHADATIFARIRHTLDA